MLAMADERTGISTAAGGELLPRPRGKFTTELSGGKARCVIGADATRSLRSDSPAALAEMLMCDGRRASGLGTAGGRPNHRGGYSGSSGEIFSGCSVFASCSAGRAATGRPQRVGVHVHRLPGRPVRAAGGGHRHQQRECSLFQDRRLAPARRVQPPGRGRHRLVRSDAEAAAGSTPINVEGIGKPETCPSRSGSAFYDWKSLLDVCE